MARQWRAPGSPSDGPAHGTVYKNATRTDWAAKRGYVQPVRAQVVTKFRPWDGELDHRRMHQFGPHGDDYMVVESNGVPVPDPGHKPPGPGHWRTSDKTRPVPRKRMHVKPTGGRIERNTGSAPKPVRRSRRTAKSTTPVTGAAELFAAWENRHN